MSHKQHVAETGPSSRPHPWSVRWHKLCRRGRLKKRHCAALKEFLDLEAQACTYRYESTPNQRMTLGFAPWGPLWCRYLALVRTASPHHLSAGQLIPPTYSDFVDIAK